MEKFKSVSADAGVRLLAEGLVDELEEPVESFVDHVHAVADAQTRLLEQIDATLEGARV